jgi:hypothetical protein
MKHLLVLAASMCLLCGCHTARPTTAATIWEYQIVDARMFVPLMDAINQRAKDGWELMSVHPPPPNSELSYAVMRRARR